MSVPASRGTVGAEVSLLAVTLVTAVAFVRLFEGGSFLLPLLVSAIVAHGVSMAARRRGWGLPFTGLVSALGFVVVSAWLFYPRTTWGGVITTTTVDVARGDLALAWGAFREAVAPVEPETGFVLSACLAMWLVAYLADWAAFRLGSAFEAIVPAGTMFVFAAVLASRGDTGHRIWIDALWLAAVLWFVLVLRTARQRAAGSWFDGRTGTGARSSLRWGGALGAAAIAAAVVVTPVIPGAHDPGLVSFGGLEGGSGSRVTVSPMVDIQRRLVEQSEVEVFTVRSSERAYWRLTSLDTFDGSIWKSRGNFEKVAGTLRTPPEELGSADEALEIVQEVEIRDLAALWLPAAYLPRHISSDEDVVYEAESATLIVGSELPTSDGLTYEVRSTLPRFDPQRLDRVPPGAPAAIAERYLDLPEDFSELAATTAADVVAGTAGPYDAALALQAFFRDGFTYSLEIPPGHDQAALDEFLTSRVGYCEQFAGAFAAMARSVGIPARVAVGFTPGIVDPDDPELYRVQGRHAHAWPEVWLEGVGWVAFEPTPSRGIPGAEPYTGVPEQQDEEPGGLTPPTTEAPTPEEADPVVPPLPDLDLDDLAGGLATGEGAGEDGGPGVAAQAGLALGALVLLAAITLSGIVVAKRLRHQSRRRGATTPRDRVRVAWTEAVERLALAGVRARPDETPTELARRVPEDLGVAPDELEQLAAAATAAAYSPEEPTHEDVERAAHTAAAVERAVSERLSNAAALRALFDPRPLFPHHQVHRVSERAAMRPRLVP